MAYVADEQTRERKLRGARMAAASAVGNGCDPDEVRRAVEEGIAEALDLDARQAGAESAARPAIPAARTSSTPALDSWAA